MIRYIQRKVLTLRLICVFPKPLQEVLCRDDDDDDELLL